jgi:hypothetical protein
VRALKRTSAPIMYAAGQYEAKKPGPILAGFLTLESSWSPPFGESFEAALEGLKPGEELQFGCALRHGAWEAMPNDESKLVVSASDEETALISFFLALLASLQRLAAVATGFSPADDSRQCTPPAGSTLPQLLRAGDSRGVDPSRD